MKEKPNHIVVVYIITLTVLALFTSLINGVFFYQLYTSFFEKSLENNLRSSAGILLRSYDFGDLEKLKQAGFNRDPEYFELLEKLDVYREEFNFAYIYAFHIDQEGDFVFVFDTANLDEDSSEWSYGESYTDYPQAFLDAIADDEIVFSETYTDRWGTFRSVFAPLHDDNADVVGILGLDYEMSLINGFERKAKRILFLSLAVGFILTLILGRFLSKSITNPFKQARIDADISQKNYKGLFNESPVPLWEEDFSELKVYIESLKARGIEDLDVFFEQHPDELKQCLNRIRVLDVNPAVLKLMDVERKELLLGRLSDLEGVTVSSFFAREVAGVGSGLYHQDWEAEIQNVRNRKIHVLFNWFVPENARNDYSRVIIGMTDLTEMKEMQNRLQQTQKMQAIGQLAGGIAHDFNNILVGIMGYTELSLAESPGSGNLSEYLNHILSAAIRARDLVSRILSFSKKSEEEFKTIMLAPLVTEVADLLKATLPSSLILDLDISDDESLKVSGVPSEIHEIIMNLASNATQAMSGKGVLTIRLKELFLTHPDKGLLGGIDIGNYALIEVIDSGEGISAENIDRIFEPFYTTKRETQGTGLGLSIVYSLVKNQGGNIQLRSIIGKGSEFRILIPVSEQEERSEHIHTPVPASGNGRILLIDDDDLVLKATRVLISSIGYDVEAVSSAREAITKLEEKDAAFDLIISDQTMPEMSGRELADYLWNRGVRLPFILCSGNSSGIGSSEGIFKVLNKPVNRSDFAAEISRIII